MSEEWWERSEPVRNALRDLLWILFAVVMLIIASTAVLIAPLQGAEPFDDTPQTILRPIYTSQFVETQTRWRWTKPAKHHDAVVRVMTGTGAGTGVMVSHNGPGALIVTGAHVIEPHNSATVTSVRTGNSFRSRLLYRDSHSDVAILYADAARPKTTLAIGGFVPQTQAEIEVVGLGGPRAKLRHFVGRFLGIRRYDGGLDFDCYVISGDSGSPVIFNGKAIVGLVRGGSRTSPGPQGWNKHYPTQSDVDGPTLARQVKTTCAQYGWQAVVVGPDCQPCRPQQPSGYGQGGLYPPAQPPTPAPTPDPVPNHPELNPPANQACEDGQPGPPGKDGTDGKDCDPGEVADLVVTKYGDRLKGERGPQGEPGPPGPMTKPTAIDYDKLSLAVLNNLDADELARRIQPHLDPIYPQWIGNDGRVIDEIPDGVHLGEPMRMRIQRRVIDASQ